MISVLSNLSPEKVKAIVDPAMAGDFAAAAKAHCAVFKLMKTMFIESNPQPIKAAMHMEGMIEPACRLPLVLCSDDSLAKLKAVMKEYGYASAQ